MRCPHCGKPVEHVTTVIKQRKKKVYAYKLCPFCQRPVELDIGGMD